MIYTSIYIRLCTFFIVDAACIMMYVWVIDVSWFKHHWASSSSPPADPPSLSLSLSFHPFSLTHSLTRSLTHCYVMDNSDLPDSLKSLQLHRVQQTWQSFSKPSSLPLLTKASLFFVFHFWWPHCMSLSPHYICTLCSTAYTLGWQSNSPQFCFNDNV